MSQPSDHEPALDPTLIIVSGQAGSGKTTLAHRLAHRIGCPAICRDEIKEGMVLSHGPGFQAAVSDPLTARTYPLFFATLALLLEGGVTVVGEAAFQHPLWSRGLQPLRDLAKLRVVRCRAEDQVMLQRRRDRSATVATRAAHFDSGMLTIDPDWDPIHLEVPTLDVDTTDGYAPALEQIVSFATGHRAGS
ncbi:AAA family ATPase [Microlunatus sp. Gsoil 973]|uniref:AAA family ATPase n=1 Tax=Microlunatus sp. Gsoil 973 TaxID=2672569 RepID=UPI0012B4894B|nr:AAA family ATPase [Microlunatus sp. Gsoil 973]QGN32157.1 AAA family ATPase [Microlunatus sp. Gsoil 973]